jgi:hypothetical protein
VERGDEDAAVEQEQMQRVLERPVVERGRGAAGARRLRGEGQLGACPERDDRPRHVAPGEHVAHAGDEALAERDHDLEGAGGEDVLERRARGGQRQRVAGQRAADAADVDEVGVLEAVDAVADLGGHAVGADRDAAGDRLADRDEVRPQAPRGRAAAGPRAERVRLVGDQQRARVVARGAQPVVEARLGQDDADVGQRRLGEHAGDLLVDQQALNGVEVVELAHARGERRVDGGSHVAGARARAYAAVERDERLVDGAVVAVAEDEHVRPPRHRPAQAQCPAVGVGGGQREAPQRHAEAAAELLAHPRGVFGRQHQRRAALLAQPPLDRRDRRRRRVPGHRARVAEREVDVAVAVDVLDRRSVRGRGVDRMTAGPLGHPGHRHAADQRPPRALEQLARARVLAGEAPALLAVDGGDPVTVERGHQRNVCQPARGG